jgi:putative tricarboxylic transport membrane protein
MKLLLPTHVAVALIGAFAIVFGVGAYELGLWQTEMPGPGLLPFAVSLLLLPLVVVVLREKVLDETPFTMTPLIAIGVTLVYAAALPYIGFVIATLLLVIFWVLVLEQQTWLRAVLTSLVLVGAGLLIFVTLLDVPMQLWPRLS